MQANSTEPQIEQTRFNRLVRGSNRSGIGAASVWLGGLLLLLILAIILFNLLRGAPGFTLVVRGAAQGSDVYVDKVRYGAAQADGTIRIEGLKAGQPRAVRVAHEGYADFTANVSGEDGEVHTIVAQLRPASTAALPPEIDYNGAMVLVGAGEFIMGDNSSPYAEEKPEHRVSLQDFYIDKFEVTNGPYKKFCDATGRAYPPNPRWHDQYFEKYPQMPVVGVRWDDAAAYAAWAGKRLPTEEEWEKAAAWDAKAGRRRRWPWGDAFQARGANLSARMPIEVGKRPAGASYYGAQDMAGNVAEWVDAYFQPYAGNTTPNDNYGKQLRVARGGHFLLSGDNARTASRFSDERDSTAATGAQPDWLTGFRCAVGANDAALQEYLSTLGREKKTATGGER